MCSSLDPNSLSLDSNIFIIASMDRMIGSWERGERNSKEITQDITDFISSSDLLFSDKIVIHNLKKKIETCENLNLKETLKKLKKAIKDPFSFKDSIPEEDSQKSDNLSGSQG